MLPRIISAIGAALTPEEIEAVVRVTSTRATFRAGIYRVLDELTGVLVEFHVYKNVAYTTPGGVLDYVGVAMPNPTPYRGVSLGVLDFGLPSIEVISEQGGNFIFCDHNSSNLCAYYGYILRNSAGQSIAEAPASSHTMYEEVFGSPGPLMRRYVNSPFFPQTYGIPEVARWQLLNAVVTNDPPFVVSSGAFSAISPSYESILAADIAAGIGGRGTYVIASDGVTLAFESQNTTDSGVNVAGSNTWSGGGFVDMFRQIGSTFTYDHKLNFTVPEDCVYPIIEEPPAYPGVSVSIALQTTYFGGSTVPGLALGVQDNGVSTATIIGPGGTVLIPGTFTATYEGVRAADGSIEESRKITGVATLVYTDFTVFSQTFGHYNVFNGIVRNTFVGGVTTNQDFSLFSSALVQTRAEYAAAAAHPDTPRWIADWAAGVAAGKARRVAWFKKNSDTALDQLKEGAFILPASWDYQIKRRCPVSSNTRRPIIISATFVDATTSPLGTLGGAVGSTAFETRTRTTTLTYTIPVIQPGGSSISEVRTEIIIGALRRTQTRLVENTTVSEIQSYVDWYTAGTTLTSGVTAPILNVLPHQFLVDKSNNGWGLFWSGTYTSGAVRRKDSTFGLPTLGLGNPQPFYINTLVGTAPPFMLTYHNEVIPEYTAPVPPAVSTGSTVFNDSAMYGVTKITLIPFGLVKNGVSLGVFPDPTDAAGATQFEYYGKARYSFDWQTGQLTFKSWTGLTGVNGEAVDSIITDLPPGVPLPAYNCVVKYESLKWEDVQTAAKKAKKDRAAGEGDKILAEILSRIK